MYSQLEFRYGTDIEAYRVRFNDSIWFDFSLPKREALFYTYTWLFSRISDDFSLYLLSIRAISISILFYVFYRIEKKSFLIIFLLSVLSPFFFSSFSNVLRQGLAMSIGLLAISQFIVFKEWRSVTLGFLCILISYGFHSASIIYFLVFPLFFYKKNLNIRNLALIWVVVSILSYFNVNELMAGYFFSSEFNYYSYVSGLDVEYEVGFRLDFVLFSLLPVLFYFVLCKELPEEFLFRVYVSFLIVYQFFSFIPFSDRILLFAWFLMPLLIVISLKKGVVSTHYKTLILSIVVIIFLSINFHSFNLASGIFK